MDCARLRVEYAATALFQKRIVIQRRYHAEDDDFSMDEDGEDDVVDDVSNDDDSDFDDDGFSAAPPTSAAALNQHHGNSSNAASDAAEELKAICLDHDTSHPVENLRIELNSFKFSQNATFHDCVKGAILAVLERVGMVEHMGAVKLMTSFKREMQYWGELVERLCHGEEEEVGLIKTLEGVATKVDGVMGRVMGEEPAFRLLLQVLYDEEVVSEEAVLRWAEERRGESDKTQHHLVPPHQLTLITIKILLFN